MRKWLKGMCVDHSVHWMMQSVIAGFGLRIIWEGADVCLELFRDNRSLCMAIDMMCRFLWRVREQFAVAVSVIAGKVREVRMAHPHSGCIVPNPRRGPLRRREKGRFLKVISSLRETRCTCLVKQWRAKQFQSNSELSSDSRNLLSTKRSFSSILLHVSLFLMQKGEN